MSDPNPLEALEALMVAVEAMAGLASMAAGYKAKCVEAGFSPENAELMAVALHQQLLAKAFDQ